MLSLQTRLGLLLLAALWIGQVTCAPLPEVEGQDIYQRDTDESDDYIYDNFFDQQNEETTVTNKPTEPPTLAPYHQPPGNQNSSAKKIKDSLAARNMLIERNANNHLWKYASVALGALLSLVVVTAVGMFLVTHISGPYDDDGGGNDSTVSFSSFDFGTNRKSVMESSKNRSTTLTNSTSTK